MNGFWGDDALNSQIRFFMERMHGNIWDFSFRVFQYWLIVEGRIMAVCFYNYPLYYLFSDLQILRLIQCATVLLNIALFSYILYYLGLKRNTILLWAILFVGLFQISDALDPTAAFAFHYQVRALELFAPLIFLLKWSKHLKTKYLIYAMIFWFWSMLFYEINAIFLAICVVFILKKSQNQERKITVQNLLIVTLPIVAYGLLNYYVRSQATNANYQGSSFGEISLFLPAYVKQLYSAFPLTFFFSQSNKAGFFDLLTIGLHSPLAWAIFIFGAIIFCIITPHVIKNELGSLVGKFEILVISLSMLLLPPILPAISARYQQEVGWGHATLPVYYQYVGAAMLILWILSRINLDSQVIRLMLALTIGLYLSLNTMMNTQTANRADAEYYRGPRELFINQTRDGLFDEVKDGDIVEVSSTPHYINANFIFEGCGKNVYVPSDDHAWYPEAPAPDGQRFKLSRNQSGRYEVVRQPAN